jgi:hypothetical protein
MELQVLTNILHTMAGIAIIVWTIIFVWLIASLFIKGK